MWLTEFSNLWAVAKFSSISLMCDVMNPFPNATVHFCWESKCIHLVCAFIMFLASHTATRYDWLAIGISNPVICPSVCDAVHCGSQGRCTGLKVHSTVFLAGMFLFVHTDTFAVGCRFVFLRCTLWLNEWLNDTSRMYRLATKCTAKKTSRRKRDREFFRQTTTCVLVYRALLTVEKSQLVSWPVVVTLEWI